MKYVRHNKKGFFLFPRSDKVWHSHIADFLGRAGIVSAGFVDSTPEGPVCVGMSESLGIKSLSEDTQLLRGNIQSYSHGVKPNIYQSRDSVCDIMLCGVDCSQGDQNCNGYCLGEADKPPTATPEIVLARKKAKAEASLAVAERAWHEYYKSCEVGDERTRAASIFENIRVATRIGY